ncbi:uncharacterized protein BP5553_01099 [Venustampulla echinocandica]|uniref:Uncharacterized protein n=1 Tax=Venustampulla echinocandica TaxID=2656787 RepID=A0A370U008_9HELO|nr:uncharacterized protein BP5553_01099 [Venustampulla echinocandica]RDL41120.1 hypothetical protein BP5553_01099 [Venustampulla echinocandica]
MVGIQWAALGALALGAVSASAFEEDWAAQLLRRQAPGSASYSCHASCGQVIVLGRTTGYCTNDVFLSSYDACLKCAGPDNENIWKDYGNSVAKAGAACDLPQEPVSGTPTDPETTAPPSTDASTAAPTAAPTAEPSAESPAASSAAPSAAPSVDSSVDSSAAPTQAPTTAATGGAANSSQAPVSSTVATTTRAGSAQGTGSATTSSAGIEFTGAAHSNAVGSVGAIVMFAAGVAAAIGV